MKKLVAIMFFGLINFDTSVNAHINFALCNDPNCPHLSKEHPQEPAELEVSTVESSSEESLQSELEN